MVDERLVFRGHPSAATILSSLLMSVVLFIAAVVAIVFLWRYLPPGNSRYWIFALFLFPIAILLPKLIQLKSRLYEITSQRIKVTRGLLTRRTDELELYRVKDTALIEPFFYRVFSAANIFVFTNDATTPQFELRGIKGAKEIREQLRQSIEECRTRKGAQIREVE